MIRTSMLGACLLLLSASGLSQTINWQSSFTPRWGDGVLSGTATNVDGSGVTVNVTVSRTGSGSFVTNNAGVSTPAINKNSSNALRPGFLSVEGSAESMDLYVDQASRSAAVEVRFTFSKPVTHLKFRVGDIDRGSWIFLSLFPPLYTFVDQVTFLGKNGGVDVKPLITAITSADLTINDNVVYASDGGDATSNNLGLVEIDFDSKPVTELIIQYNNHSTSGSDPARQAIAIGNLSFNRADITVSGYIWNDANGNGLKTGMEPFINGTNSGNGLATGRVLYVNLMDPAGNVLATAPVQQDGQYSLSGVPSSTQNLTLQLNSVSGVAGAAKPALQLPGGWGVSSINTNGQNGAVSTLSAAEIRFNAGTGSIPQQNFGLNRLPVATNRALVMATPVANTFIDLHAVAGTPVGLLGSDGEDGPLGNGNRVAITALPVHGNELWYNNVLITRGRDGVNAPSPSNPHIIEGFQAASLKLKATAQGSLGDQFSYAFLDAASMQGGEATYTITWVTPLPLKLTHFSARGSQGNAVLTWSAAGQQHFDHFEIEYSPAGTGTFSKVGTIISNNQASGTYSFTHMNAGAAGATAYYRLKMIDTEGTYQYSQIIAVRFVATETVSVQSRLLKAGQPIRVKPSGASGESLILRLFDAGSRAVQEQRASVSELIWIETATLKPGVYFLQLIQKGEMQTFRIVIQ